MEEKNIEEEKKAKPERYKLAIWSPALTILAVFLLMISFLLGIEDTPVIDIVVFLLFVLPIIGFILGVVSYYMIDKSRGKYCGKPLAGLGIIVPLFIFLSMLLPDGCPSPEKAYMIICKSQLHQMGKIMLLYEYDNQKFPSDKWCKIVWKESDPNGESDPNKLFICVGAKHAKIEGKCHYAMNPDAEPNSPSDTVLLFDSKPGWNNYGGKKLLAPENHRGKGCNIAFVDGSIEFIKVEDFNDLRWK